MNGDGTRILPWVAVALAAAALGAALTGGLVNAGRLDDLRARNKALEEEIAALEAAAGRQNSTLDWHSRRLEGAEGRMNELATQAARTAQAVRDGKEPPVEKPIKRYHGKDPKAAAAVKDLYAKGRAGDLSLALKQLNHPDEWVRFSAVDCLATFGKAEHYEAVLARLDAEKPDTLPRGGVIYAMGQLGGERALNPLLELLAGANQKDRHVAAKALRSNKELAGRPEVRAALEKFAQDAWPVKTKPPVLPEPPDPPEEF